MANEAKTMAVVRGGTEMKAAVPHTQNRENWSRGRPSSCYRSREFAREKVDWVWEVVWATGYLRGRRSACARGGRTGWEQRLSRHDGEEVARPSGWGER